jgi:phosphate transport system substrate-binding protein
MTKWASVYEKEKGPQIDYSSTGSGNGIQQMIAKTIDFGCSDAPLNQEQLDKARQAGGEVIHIPLAMGAVVPIYNLPDLDKPLRFTGPLLADIYLGKIKKWNDPGLREVNPDLTLPELEISVARRSDGSGTTFIWTDYLTKVSPEWKDKVGVGTTVNWPVGSGDKGSEGMAGKVARSPGAIGYVELLYARQNNLKYGAVRNKEGQFVSASLEAVTAAAASGLTNIPDDLRYSLTDAPGSDSYPIPGTVWAVLYVNQQPPKGEQLVQFLRWATHEGQQQARDLGYAPLPSGLVERLERKLEQVKSVQ